jgi:hypothetical protein
VIGSGHDDGDVVNGNDMSNTYLKVCYGVFAGKVFELRVREREKRREMRARRRGCGGEELGDGDGCEGLREEGVRLCLAMNLPIPRSHRLTRSGSERTKEKFQ